MNALVPEEKRIPMREFPLKPGDVIVQSFNQVTEEEQIHLGKVMEVYVRNPEGYTVAARTSEDLEALYGGPHTNIRLRYEDTMYALVVFATIAGPVAKCFYAYDIVDMMSKNELQVVRPDDFFSNHLTVMLANS
ncbi:MAG: hypothetical protein A3H69_00310 [Candidatus Sungbacteria bacterium RIFCSPLOWO2_02_FULL_47_9]|uniref:Uncharacterized protein n=1 Tax=Candidatus Sungbacteria bacterium RIFCSPHIGHO2_01_FULL_47_32 TaxID=1802264 RepID=A0A1G2K4T8_9BACT|nr:MAG: hypothetical protein UX72_C0012G0009 [Parcubacteria group bacterium GW2011_GWA2_47_10]OGZ94173.1 MAG: hypothetical protein A2633_02905 [Candidatus Sungbacteria bacterium RIFCSPHIGHO2_01_FULL_47_32]OHA00005.1 MAG: hypothetical protein A3D57_03710 [Candidatus Sungbacteria bacterium RIFCSPHIGHO2_02_FULL_46_12]OHA06263.1 MAG: hypothetical protein A3A28_02100 [Candidatus Sungbacteria bacterium RIFCSPLOWO2_01_FULL_47_32]OHA09776.1 MAG: hypothetical protein A3H69_00310 [Candidatus Sungbacteria